MKITIEPGGTKTRKIPITEPLEGETKYSPKYIYRQIFGTRMRGHHQTWPDIHLGELRLLNPDTVGWIRMEGSPVNYPVVRERPGDSWYLKYNFSGEESCHGAVFMRGTGTLGERTTALCAHHMKDGSMFFAVSQLYFPEYYETHRGLELLLADGLYRAEFFAVHLIDQDDPEMTRAGFSSDADYEGCLAARKRQALYDIPLTPDVRDRVLILTTCVYPDNEADRQYNGIAAYAVIRRVQERSLLPAHIEKRGAPPGTGEHQLGLAVDISCEDANAADFTVRWLQRNAWRYDFILRYPEGKEDVTGIMYESWHYRFVGREAAEEMQRLGIVPEEYPELFYD